MDDPVAATDSAKRHVLRLMEPWYELDADVRRIESRCIQAVE
jgi:hypothetical protein